MNWSHANKSDAPFLVYKLTAAACLNADDFVHVRNQAVHGKQNIMLETIQLGEIMVPFYSEPVESLSAARPAGVVAARDLVQIPGRFVSEPGATMTRYRQLMPELDSIRFVQPMRTPTPEPTARFGSAPATFAGAGSSKLSPNFWLRVLFKYVDFRQFLVYRLFIFSFNSTCFM